MEQTEKKILFEIEVSRPRICMKLGVVENIDLIGIFYVRRTTK